MSAEFDRESPAKFDVRTLSRETLSRWAGRIIPKLYEVSRGCEARWTPRPAPAAACRRYDYQHDSTSATTKLSLL